MIVAFGRWLSDPLPARLLALLRVVVGLYGLGWLALTAGELRGLASLDPQRFSPVGIVGMSGVGAADRATITAWLALCALAGVACTAGVAYRFSAPAFAVGILWLATYQNSWGKLLHTENLLVVHLLVLAASPAADALTLHRRRRQGWPRRPLSGPNYSWAVRVMALATVLAYLAAGITKFRHGGLAWLDPENLRNWVAYDLVRKELYGDPYLPLAAPLLDHAWAFAPAAWFTLAVELGAPLALLRRRLAIRWSAAAWVLHAAVLAMMSVAFPYHLLGLAALPVLLAARSPSGSERSGRAETSVAGTAPAEPVGVVGHHPAPRRRVP